MSEISPEDLYRRLGRLIEGCPSFSGISSLSVQQLTWLGRAEALVLASNDKIAAAEFAASRASLAYSTMREAGHQGVMMTLYRVLAKAELAAPAAAQGAFIPVGSSFDAYSALAKVFAQATTDILLVDPYMDDSVLLDFGGAVPDTVSLRLLSDQATANNPSVPLQQMEGAVSESESAGSSSFVADIARPSDAG